MLILIFIFPPTPCCFYFLRFVARQVTKDISLSFFLPQAHSLQVLIEIFICDIEAAHIDDD